MKKSILGLYIVLSMFLVMMGFVSAADCWQYTTQTGCQEDTSCKWKQDAWGSWCEELNCWSLYSQTECSTTTVPGKNCTWQSSTGWGWCEQTMCSSFDTTNESACETNTLGLRCEWDAECFGWNPSVSCYSLTSQSACVNASGCSWGRCDQLGCWDHDTQEECISAIGSKGYSCSWNSNYSYCYEAGCWDYAGTNQTACEQNSVGMNCTWVDNYYNYKTCQEPSCWLLDHTNESACINNSYNLSCSWDGQYCTMGGCWNYNDVTSCNGISGCSWKASSGSGWCEEIQCWTWDGWRGGDESNCVNNTYELSCAWEAGGLDGGWCYPDLDVSCSNMTTERECIDTHYCWWQFYNWENTSAGGICNDPSGFGGGGGPSLINFDNPECYLFDINATKCNLVQGCSFVDGICIINGTHPNANVIMDRGINCTMINDSAMCNDIGALSSCCQWNASLCIENQISTSCKDKIDRFLDDVGVKSCADVVMKTSDSVSAEALCNRLSQEGNLPCRWDNSTKSCLIKSELFGNGTQSCDKINNENLCGAAGCKWVQENYCEGNISVPAGRCEQKSSDERNCMKSCYACDYNFDGVNHSSLATAKEYCYQNPKCGFTEDSTAPNSYGFCKAKDQFKKGLVSDCKSDCGTCTYFGNPIAANEYDGSSKSYSTCNTPKCYCEQAYEFNNVKCKWVADSSKTEGGYCLDSSEKTCSDACDRCYTRTDCSEKGRKAIGAAGSCQWSNSDSETDGTCSKTGETSEICWDAIDNDADNLIDCADPGCFSDSFCGFVQGDCFGWSTQVQCETAQLPNGLNCSWITDPWSSWCDFPGSDCWKYDGDQGNCTLKSACEWTSGIGTGNCEQDWSFGQDCYNIKNLIGCEASPSSCVWSNDTWCQSSGSTTDWCLTQGGWCNPATFAPKNCWNYDGNQTLCTAAEGCAWHNNEWGAGCEVDWSSFAPCGMFSNSSDYCEANGCVWRTSGSSSWCDNKFSACNGYSALECSQHSDVCVYDSSGFCEAKCYNQSLGEDGCNAVSGCIWSSGWCEQDWSAGGVSCWDEPTYSDQANCSGTEGCKWKNPGWCNPKGFSGGDAYAGGGQGAVPGMECWKYDGNDTACTNKTLIGMECSWMPEMRPFCESDFSANCWQYNWNQTRCNEITSCMWFGDNITGWCGNVFDQCWNNMTVSTNQTLCDLNPYCNWTTGIGGGYDGWCEAKCFSLTAEADCTGACKWKDGWCNTPGMYEMFGGMESGAPVMIAQDDCNELSIKPHVDICGAGLKDMGDSFGFGSGVREFSNASICNGEKIGFGFNSMSGNGNETLRYYIYLDTNGNTSGGCTLPNNESAVGYEFMFKYVSRWNSTLGKAVETFNAYKCSSNTWQMSDVTLSAWKEKMCGEIQGPMVAVKKTDLEKYPSLYVSGSDMRVYIVIADNEHNTTAPSDTAGPGWITPGSIDFSLDSFSKTDIDTAKFENMLKEGYVKHEDCFNLVDDDADGSIDCNDWDCEFAPLCANTGVNSDTYTDTSTPTIVGLKVEEYLDSALVMYDTSKPTNGTLNFYFNDSSCTILNKTIKDVGLTKNDTSRTYKLWHMGEIYDDSGIISLDYSLQANKTYYYKLEVCDRAGKCAVSACSSFATPPNEKDCPYCNFVTVIKAPTGWEVSYDIDQDGIYDHRQGFICGLSAGMKTNYSSGRRTDIKLNNSYGGEILFFNVTLTKTGLTDDIRTISTSGSLIFDNDLVTSGGDTIGAVGMMSSTRDKIINNMHPEVCRITIPKGTTQCEALYHCDDSGDNCVDRTNESTLITNGTTTCAWQIPYCEFSMWSGGESYSPPGGSPSGGGGGGGSSTTTSQDIALTTTSTKYSGLAKGSKLTFLINEEAHALSISNIDSASGKVTFTLSSTQQIFALIVGESKTFEFGDDKFYVKLDAITGNKADIIVKKIVPLPIVELPQAEQKEREVSDEPSAPEEAERTITEPNANLLNKTDLLFLVSAGVILAVLATIATFIFKKKKKFY